jgi:hypothetical protein
VDAVFAQDIEALRFADAARSYESYRGILKKVWQNRDKVSKSFYELIRNILLKEINIMRKRMSWFAPWEIT